MTKEKEKLRRAHEEIFARIVSYLTEGKIVAFLTIGDPSVYSTYGYIHRRVAAWGGNVENDKRRAVLLRGCGESWNIARG